MARKPISTLTRKVIWEAHKRRSPYDGGIIPWGELHIDHLIPVTDPVHLEQAIKLKIVDDKFDIDGFENLLPSRSHQNLGKTDDDWSEGTLRYFLEIARGIKPKVEELMVRELRDEAALQAYLKLKIAAERNEVSVEEMFTYIRHQVEGEVPLRISPGVDGAEIFAANTTVAAKLMDAPFALGGGSINEFTLHSDTEGEIVVKTANEYLAAKARGYYAYTTFEIKAESMADETTQLLKAVRDSRYAVESEIREPIVTMSNLDRWHAEWATAAIMDPDDSTDLVRFRTIHDLVLAGICHIERHDQWELRFSVDNGLSVVMRELLRADLDGDNKEEILVSHYVYAPEGTLGAGMTVTAKMDVDGLLRRGTAKQE